MSQGNNPLLHVFSKLDSRFSFSGADETDRIEQDAIHRAVSREPWFQETLSIVVIGASGDLAKKKTYPSLLSLFESSLLPQDLVIWGYARSVKTHQELRDHLRPHLLKSGSCEVVVKQFLEKCFYHSGKSYGDEEAIADMASKIASFESTTASPVCNRLFYLAIPPNVFGETGIAIKNVGVAMTGWTRVVIEKPFGRDLESCDELLGTLSSNFTSQMLYLVDHYNAKEVVQNMILFRFGNSIFEWMWNRNTVESVTVTFKEPFGTDGRGGYFDNFGIIRDILQNHLLQVLAAFAMEPPAGDDGDSIRDAKTEVLKNMDVLTLEDALLGQYDGYADDPTIENKDTNCPTYAALRCRIKTPRWEGVPFLLQAGKALDEKLCEVRVRYKTPSTLQSIRSSAKKLAPNELVLRLQPKPSLELHTNIKTPGLSSQPMTVPMKMDYEQDIPGMSNPDAYTRLLLDVLRGRQGSFVREDELRRSWEIFTPLLHTIERDNIRPAPYKVGSKGPDQREEWFEEMSRFQANGSAIATPFQSAL